MYVEQVNHPPPVTTTTRTIHQTNGTAVIGTVTYSDQLEADLATGVRGGNKFRLIARIWWGMHGHQLEGYAAFRTAQARRTFAQLHADFDQHLDPRWRWATNTGDAVATTVATIAPAHTQKAAKLQATFLTTQELDAATRAWITAQGGVLALDGRRMVARRSNGTTTRPFPVLDACWSHTANAVRRLMNGTGHWA